jgi:hypothetical protein
MYSLILDLGKQVRDIKMNLEIKENIVSKLKIRPNIKLQSLPMDDYNIFMSFGRSIQGEEGKHAPHALVPNFFFPIFVAFIVISSYRYAFLGSSATV